MYLVCMCNRNYLPQVRAFKCSAKCCEDQYSSQQVIQSCLKTCMTPVAETEGRLKQEVEQLQVSEKSSGTVVVGM